MNWLSEQYSLILQEGILNVLFVFCVILLLETILSVDNATALASIINKRLSTEKERKKALTYGIFGAYLFRGLSLFFINYLIMNPNVGVIIKIIGGAYLLRLFFTHFTPKKDSIEEGDTSWVDSITVRLGISSMVSTIIAVEVLDLSLSIDNVLACISLSNIVLVVILAVFVGILLMRFVTQYFCKLMVKYPALEGSAFIVIGLLGLKLCISGVADYFPMFIEVKHLLESHYFDFVFSTVTILIFLYPLIKRK